MLCWLKKSWVVVFVVDLLVFARIWEGPTTPHYWFGELYYFYSHCVFRAPAAASSDDAQYTYVRLGTLLPIKIDMMEISTGNLKSLLYSNDYMFLVRPSCVLFGLYTHCIFRWWFNITYVRTVLYYRYHLILHDGDQCSKPSKQKTYFRSLEYSTNLLTLSYLHHSGIPIRRKKYTPHNPHRDPFRSRSLRIHNPHVYTWNHEIQGSSNPSPRSPWNYRRSRGRKGSRTASNFHSPNVQYDPCHPGCWKTRDT